jgi:hypothetical protein
MTDPIDDLLNRPTDAPPPDDEPADTDPGDEPADDVEDDQDAPEPQGVFRIGGS